MCIATAVYGTYDCFNSQNKLNVNSLFICMNSKHATLTNMQCNLLEQMLYLSGNTECFPDLHMHYVKNCCLFTMCFFSILAYFTQHSMPHKEQLVIKTFTISDSWW